jgi:glutamyl-tRNA reductase
VTFEELPRELEHADIVVSSTGAPHQIVGREELEFVAASRMGRPLVLIDLAVPRDFDPGVRDCPGIALYDIDDLQQAVARNMSVREAEAEEARSLLAEEVNRFEGWLDSLDVIPTISALRRRGEEIVEQVLRENESRWEALTEADRERVGVLARAVVGRLLHEPTLRLKGSAGEHASYRYLHAMRELFALQGDPGPTLRGESALAPHEASVTRLDARRRSR